MTSTRDRFVLSKGTVTVDRTRVVPGTIFVVTQLSYQDAGVYTCEGRSICTDSNETSPWTSATLDLSLIHI